MINSRRRFLKHSLAGSAAISLSAAAPQFLLNTSRAAETQGDDRILVVVQLSGGNDGLNTVIPFGDDNYYRNRFTLAIPKNNVLKINDQIGFHPALKGFAGLLEQQKLAVIQGVGYKNPNRSHFESMDLWHSAHQMEHDTPTGWLGKLVHENYSQQDLPALHLGSGLQPLALKTKSKPIPSIQKIDNFRLKLLKRTQQKAALNKLIRQPRDTKNSLLSYIHDSADVALETSHQLEGLSDNKKSKAKYPVTQLGRNLSIISQLINSGLKTRVYYTTLDGFDTHSNQGDAHRSLLQDLGDSVAAFMKDIEDQGNQDRVSLLSFSEFGRRVRENASRGTDHGAAAPLFVCGPRVNAGLIGDHPSLTDLDEGDMKFKIDYRRVYQDLMGKWLGVDAQPILGAKFRSCGVFKTKV